MLGEIFKRIIKEYPFTEDEREKRPFKGDSTATYMRRDASEGLGNIIKSSYDLDDYKTHFSPGIGSWNHDPWGGILKYEITKTFKKGFYIGYAFINGGKGICLSLGQAYDAIIENNDIDDVEGELNSRARFLRKYLSKIPEGFLNPENDIDNEKRQDIGPGHIIDKFYSIDDLDNEKMLLDDLYVMMELYNELIPIYKEKFMDNAILEDKKNYEIKKWTFAINNDFYPDLKEQDEIKWNSAKSVKKGDIILVYTGAPYSSIGFILKAITDPFEDPEIRKDWNKPAVVVRKIAEMSNPIKFSELKENSILREWGAVKMGFRGSNFKMTNEEWEELKKLILEKNSGLKNEMVELTDSYSNYAELKTIMDADEIKKAQNEFAERFKEIKDEIIEASPGASKMDMLWSSKLNIWASFGESNTYYFNPFGIGKPVPNSVNKTTVEINFPYEGINRRISGVFAKDSLGDIYLLHRGNLGGKFAGKKLLEENYNKNWVKITDGDIKSNLILIGRLNEPDFPEKVKKFVFEVNRIKNGTSTEKNGDLEIKPNIWKITPGSIKEKEQEKLWPLYKKEGFIGIGWLHDARSYLEFQDIDELKAALYEFHPYYKDKDATTAANMIWDFTYNIKKGDLIIANAGRGKILGIGIIKSDYIDPMSTENPGIFDYFWHLRKVNWVITDEMPLDTPYFFDMKTVTKLNETKWNKIKEAYIKKYSHYEKIFKELENEDLRTVPKDCPLISMDPSNIETTLKINPKTLDQVCGTLNSRKHILLTGAPGTGKTNLAEDICKIASAKNFSDGYILTTATSDWTTFDTIGGYMPDEYAKLNFEDGKFLQAIRENKWLIIDEINRADIDKAFGQLFTVLSGQGVELPFKNNGKSIKIRPSNENRSYYDEEASTYKVGKNWRILATMNVYDKDYLFEMSYAFMRRFTFIYIDLPEDQEFKELFELWKDDLSQNYVELIEKLLEINKHRQIGPAIFKDIIEFVNEMEKMESQNNIVADAVISYILPQLEGLDDLKIRKIWNIFKTTFEDSYEIKKRLEEISGIQLEKSQSE